MKSLLLFTDGSADPASRIGYGAYLAVPGLNTDFPESEAIDNLRMQIASNASGSSLETCVQLKRFEDTSSSQLEIETLIWALRSTQPQTVILYTDSQNIIGLPDRRVRMEKQDYRSKTGGLLNHAELYQEFFALTDLLDYTLVKVKGHRRSHQKSPADRMFTLVDRASRQALRAELAKR
jgi:ribonuclease HI